MTRLTISMPEQLSTWVESQVSAGRYGNVSEYFRDLVRHDQERREIAVTELRRLLHEAEAGGVIPYDFKEVLSEARKEARLQGKG